jgi:L-alanine-DL-glutamate epimerase-like enolase superfamily enzyme
MKLSWQPVTLDLRTTWRIAHGASDQRFNVIVRIGDDMLSGIGEAAGVPQHNESQSGILEYLSTLPEIQWDPYDMENILNSLPPGSRAGRAAIDMALHDLLGKQLGQPLYRILGLDPSKIPPTSFTIAIDDPQVMAERARASAWPVIKVKLGSPDDEAIVSAIRHATDARLRVDANSGWTREQAVDLIPRLAQYNLEFVEQPLPPQDIEGLRWLRQQKLGLPIFADESVRDSHEVAALAGAVDGVVIKVLKTCGIREALRAIHTARALDMQVMISCMVETSVAVTAAAHLAPLCDFADLDGPLLIRNDPYKGVTYEGARMILPDRPGLGLQEAS